MVTFLHHQDTTIDLILIFLGFSKANLDLIKACTCGCGLWVMTETEVAQTQTTQKLPIMWSRRIFIIAAVSPRILK